MLEVIKPIQSDFNCYCTLLVHDQDAVHGSVASIQRVENSPQVEVSLKFQTAILQLQRLRRHYWSHGSFYVLLKEYFRSFVGFYDNRRVSYVADFYRIVRTIVYTYFKLPRHSKFIRDIEFNDIDGSITIRTITLLIGSKEITLDL